MKTTLDAACQSCGVAIPATNNTRIGDNQYQCARCRREQPSREDLIEELLERRDNLRDALARAEAKLLDLRGDEP